MQCKKVNLIQFRQGSIQKNSMSMLYLETFLCMKQTNLIFSSILFKSTLNVASSCSQTSVSLTANTCSVIETFIGALVPFMVLKTVVVPMRADDEIIFPTLSLLQAGPHGPLPKSHPVIN